jgi:hypothetical protein
MEGAFEGAQKSPFLQLWHSRPSRNGGCMEFRPPVYARYHRGTHGAKGRGCGKVFSGIAADGVCGRACGYAGVARVVIYPANCGPCMSVSWALRVACAWQMIPCERTVSRRTGGRHTISRAGQNNGQSADSWRTPGRQRAT